MNLKSHKSPINQVDIIALIARKLRIINKKSKPPSVKLSMELGFEPMTFWIQSPFSFHYTTLPLNYLHWFTIPCGIKSQVMHKDAVKLLCPWFLLLLAAYFPLLPRKSGQFPPHYLLTSIFKTLNKPCFQTKMPCCCCCFFIKSCLSKFCLEFTSTKPFLMTFIHF